MPSAKGELKNYTRIWNPLMEAIRKANLGSAEFRILMALLYRSYGFHQTEAEMSYRDWSVETGIPKPTISRVVKALRDKGVIEEINPPTFQRPGRYRIVKDFRRWKPGVVDISSISEMSMNLLEEECGINDNCSRDDNSIHDMNSYHDDNSSHGDNSNSSHGVNSEEPIFPVTTPDSGPLQENKQEINTAADDVLDARAVDQPRETSDHDNSMFDEIEARMRIRTGKHGYILVGTEFEAAKSVLDAGVPLPFVLQGIDRAFEKHRPKYPGDKIRSFSYCQPIILELWQAEQERAAAGNTMPARHAKNGGIDGGAYSRARGDPDRKAAKSAADWLRQQVGSRAPGV